MAGAAAYDNWPNDHVIISLARDANQGLVDGDSGEVSLRKRRSRANYPALVVKRQRNAEEELIHQLDRSEPFRRTLNLYRKIKKTLSPVPGDSKADCGGRPPAAGFGGWQHMLLPVSCLVLYPLGGLVRITRTAVLDVLNQDYVVVARSKGLPERVVVLRHVLRNALIPIVSFMGVMLVNVFLTGSVVIEAVFAWPGVGYLTWNAVTTRDFPLVQGAILMLGAMVILANSAVDTVYGLLDPRVRRHQLETEPGTSWQ